MKDDKEIICVESLASLYHCGNDIKRQILCTAVKMHERLWLALSLDGYTPHQIETYLAAAGPAEFTKTHGRKSVAGLNKAVDMLYWTYDYVDRSELFQPKLSRRINKDLCHAAGFPDEGYGYPQEFFRRDMRRIMPCIEDIEQ